jgi:hypothetical protein
MNRLKTTTVFLLALALALVSTVAIVHAVPPSETLHPNEDITSSPPQEGWNYYSTVPDLGQNYQNVQTNDGDASYISARINAKTQVFGFPDISEGGYTITSITVCAVVKSMSHELTGFYLKIWTDGSEHSSDKVVLDPIDYVHTDYYNQYSYTWDFNPHTGNSWTIDDINNLKSGIQMSFTRIGSEAHELWATEFYIVVNEVPAETVPEYFFGALMATVACFAAFIIIKRPHFNLRIK